MARFQGEKQVVRSHEVRGRVVEFKAHSDGKATCLAVNFLLATVESTERLGALAKNALFPEAPALIGIEEVDPTMADFARSMILFAGAGIDATLKQLVRDCLRHAIDNNTDASVQFRKYVERILARDSVAVSAKALCSPSPRDYLVEQYASELTGGSFQSYQQIAKAAASLGVDALAKRKAVFERLFKERNVVAHELDLLDSEVHGMDRRGRSVEDAWGIAEEAYGATLDLIELVDSRFV